MKKFNKWFLIRDLVQIKKYGLISHLKYLFDYGKTVVYVQSNLSIMPVLQDISPYTTRELDVYNEKDLLIWANIINQAYGEEQYDEKLAQMKLTNHEFLNILKVFLIFHEEKCIGTVSAATFKSNPKIASGCRFAVHPDYQGKGLGKYLYLYIMYYLRDNGFRYFESTMSIKRQTSFILKFKLGFYPQFNRKYVQFKSQKRFFAIRWLANHKLNQLWKRHQRSLNKQFAQLSP